MSTTIVKPAPDQDPQVLDDQTPKNQDKTSDLSTLVTTETLNLPNETPNPLSDSIAIASPDTEDSDKELNELCIDEVLKVNSNQVDFGDVFPGQIIEETIIILNSLNKTKVPFKVKVNCLSEEFEDLDEYVFSMRRPTPNETFNYNDTFLIILAQKAISYYKLAIKVPNITEPMKIMGNIEITSEKTKNSIIVIPITANITLPKLKCEKMMRIKSLNISVVKLFMKNVIRQDFRIAIKNMSNSPVFAEMAIVKNERLVDFLDFNFYPAQMCFQPLVPNNFVMCVKTRQSGMEYLNTDVHFVMIVKIRNSSIIYHFPVLLTIGDGKSN